MKLNMLTMCLVVECKQMTKQNKDQERKETIITNEAKFTFGKKK